MKWLTHLNPPCPFITPFCHIERARTRRIQDRKARQKYNFVWTFSEMTMGIQIRPKKYVYISIGPWFTGYIENKFPIWSWTIDLVFILIAIFKCFSASQNAQTSRTFSGFGLQLLRDRLLSDSPDLTYSHNTCCAVQRHLQQRFCPGKHAARRLSDITTNQAIIPAHRLNMRFLSQMVTH